MEVTKKFGFYSAEAAKLCGTVFWTTPQGTEVEITAALNDKKGSMYKWKDKVFVGEVISFSCRGRDSSWSKLSPLSAADLREKWNGNSQE